MRILIFCALKEEALPIVRMLHLHQKGISPCIYQGEWKRHSIELAVTGCGKKNTLKACSYVLTMSPDLFVSCGFAGGLDQKLEVGDVVLAEQLLFWEEGSLLDEPRICSLEESYKKFKTIFQRTFSGTVLTTHRVIHRSEEKKNLARCFSALAVDMESGYAAQYASDKGVPFLALKVVTDTADEDLKIDFSPWLGENGDLRKFRMVGSLLTQPHQWRWFLKMMWSGIKAKKALAESVRTLIEGLENA